jgi:hypothetical protein
LSLTWSHLFDMRAMEDQRSHGEYVALTIHCDDVAVSDQSSRHRRTTGLNIWLQVSRGRRNGRTRRGGISELPFCGSRFCERRA